MGTRDTPGAEESTPGVTGPLAQVTQHTFLQSLLCSNYYSAPPRHCSEQRKQQGTVQQASVLKKGERPVKNTSGSGTRPALALKEQIEMSNTELLILKMRRNCLGVLLKYKF